MNTPMDIRLGLTKEEDNQPRTFGGGSSALRPFRPTGFKSLQDVPGAKFTAIAARDMDRARAFADADMKSQLRMTRTTTLSTTTMLTSFISRLKHGTITAT